MKKLFLTVLMMLLCAGVFAGGYTLIGLDGSFQMMSGTINILDEKTDFNAFSPCVGFSMFYHTDESNWGMKMSTNLFFPKNGDITVGNKEYSFSDDIFDSIIGTESLIAGNYIVKRSETFIMPVSLGFHYALYTFNIDDILSYGSFNLGIGTSISAITFFSESFYCLTDLQLAYDFYQNSWYSLPGGIDDGNSGGSSQIIFTPKIGIGFKVKNRTR